MSAPSEFIHMSIGKPLSDGSKRPAKFMLGSILEFFIISKFLSSILKFNDEDKLVLMEIYKKINKNNVKNEL